MKCFMCKGDLIEKEVNYLVDLDKTIIIIKSVPARVCTQCDEKFFDDEVAKKLEEMFPDAIKLLADYGNLLQMKILEYFAN